MMELKKNMRIRAVWMEAQPLGSASLAGVQPKVTAKKNVVEGKITHIRGDHPVSPKSVGIWVMTDDGDEVVVDAQHVVAVINTET